MALIVGNYDLIPLPRALGDDSPESDTLFPAFYPPMEVGGILEHFIPAYTLAPIFSFLWP